ncbi:50s ribosomal protein mrp49 [Colletotrichum kahawae]|uniref:50s ribosomal protein mrp49 n=1 Tax=Colletotrichum kahawae TaxID=34407 RepID=A0AAD9YUF9_COLKA|nr:50s ribosomal protein mrp49 [Colletotrichum camelliae]KAK2780255.1 50s ribosomal protein mrp49 [Colletotrichum kahawae]
MVNVGKRWHALRAILSIRHGPGAAILPPNVTRIHMEFAKTMEGGHMGPRKFWHNMLRRLKYHNPAVPMIVNRKSTNEGAAMMHIYFSKGAPIDPATLPQNPSSAMDGSKAPEPTENERVVKFDIKDKRSEEILERFIAEAEATPVTPTPEELREMEEVEKLRVKSEADRVANAKIRDEARKQKAMLDKARAEVAV